MRVICTTCGNEKERQRFSLGELARPKPRCRNCKSQATQRWRRANHARSESYNRQEKRCPTCQTVKPIDLFPHDRGAKDGHGGVCKPCTNNERVHRRKTKRYRDSHRAYYVKIRAEVLAAYGGRCACCGESDPCFLAIDHVNDDGHIHRRSVSGGIQMYLWLRKHGYPKDRFRLLCHNCNQARAFYGACPHAADSRTYEPGLTAGLI